MKIKNKTEANNVHDDHISNKVERRRIHETVRWKQKEKNATMGLDVHLSVISVEKYYQKVEEHNIDLLEIGLSRTFCNFLCRDGVVDHETELNQISKIVNVDITPIEKMNCYCDKIDMEAQFGIYETEEEINEFVQQTIENNQKVIGNIEQVIKTLKELIKELSKIEDLPSLLIRTNYDTLGNNRYFSTFTENLGDGYIGNNFGQDLRNLLKQVEFAKTIGEDTVYFQYG